VRHALRLVLGLCLVAAAGCGEDLPAGGGGEGGGASVAASGAGGADGAGGGPVAEATSVGPGSGDAAATGSASSAAAGGGQGEGGGGGESSEPAATRKIADLTGPGTSAEPFGVGGTDLGIPVRQPDGQIAYIFGDTFEQNTVGGPGWRSPVLLRSAPGGLDEGITFTGAAGGAYAKQILDYSHESAEWSTWLPTDAITIGDRMYLHFMVNQGLGNVRWSQIAYSDDDGESWTVADARWEGNENANLRQLWTWERGDDGYVYVLSTSFTRSDPIILHRVPEGSLLDEGAYEPWGYLGDAWAWGNPATPVLTGQFGELCLRRVEDRWVLSWFNAEDYDITIKVFDGPTSNLFTATTYKPIRGGAWGFEDDTTVAQLYGGYIHPDSTLHELHLIVSQWNTETNWPYRAMQFVTGVE
jgi:hypothetical protein